MSFQDLDRGDRSELHLRLYEREHKVLTDLAERYNTSRASIVGALIQYFIEHNEPDLTGRVRVGEPGAPSRRR